MSSVCTRLSGRLFSFCEQICKNQILGSRTLFSPAAMGFDSYNQTRERVKAQFKEMEERFRKKMNDFVTPNSVNMVFTEDLKNMLYLAESEDADLDLLEKMMLKFNEQNKDLRFGSYVFGPVIMRTYHRLNKPEEAFKAFKNPGLNGLFDQLGTYQILLDLLFINEKYDEMLEVTDYIVNKQHKGAKYPRNVVVLTTAACYKKNTPESFQYINKMWADLQESGHQPMRRAVTFVAALALNQGAPHVALELISNTGRQNYVTVRNLKVSALTDLNRLDDTLPILRSVLELDSPNQMKHTFYKEIIDKVKAAIEKSGKKEIILEFNRIYEQLESQGHITNTTLDEQLCSDIEATQNPFQQQFREQGMVAASFQSRNPRDFAGRRRFPQRPGLRDMI